MGVAAMFSATNAIASMGNMVWYMYSRSVSGRTMTHPRSRRRYITAYLAFSLHTLVLNLLAYTCPAHTRALHAPFNAPLSTYTCLL